MLSARLVKIIGTRAPTTIPAAVAPARKVRLFASIFPASKSGTISTLAAPATGETMCLVAAASRLMALSSASGSVQHRTGNLAAIGHLAERRGFQRARDIRVDRLHRR